MGAPDLIVPGTASGTAPVGGTGTPNTIPRWTGPSTLGDSVITQSGSNIGFGLGANAPISRWHALVPNSGASPTASDWTSSFSATGDYRSGFGFQFSAGTAASNRVACLVSNGTNTGQTVVWTADGTGNVGIGTASPGARLHVLNNSANALARFESSIANGAYALWHNGTNTALFAGFGSTLDSAATVDDAVLRYQATKVLIISRGGSEAARFDSSGNVGIGTASTPYRLTVTASVAQIGAFSTTDANSGFLEWRYGGGNAGYIGNGASILTGASATDFIVRSAGALKFATNGNNLRATIDASGNVYGTSGTTGMTDGFFYIPGAAGAPTGTPTAVSGRVPMYYDTTNNQFYVYNGAWKKVTLA